MRDLCRSETRRERGVCWRAGRLLRKVFLRQLRHLTAIPIGAAGGKERLDRRMELGDLEVGRSIRTSTARNIAKDERSNSQKSRHRRREIM